MATGWRCILADVSYAGSGRACGVGDCACLVPILGDLGETSGPRIDRFPPTRPSWRDRQYRELKKVFFSAPRKCPIGLFGPVANRNDTRRTACRISCLLVSYNPLAPPPKPIMLGSARYARRIANLKLQRVPALPAIQSTPLFAAPAPHCCSEKLFQLDASRRVKL